MRYPSEYDNEELERYLLDQIENDISWRDQFVDFDKCVDLYEMRSGTKDGSGIPQENMIAPAVKDHLAVAVMNLPKAKLSAIRDVVGKENALERELMSLVYDTAEQTMNSYVRTILLESQYNDIVQDVLADAAIYGVGYLFVEIDERASLADNFELRDLMSRVESWTAEDAKRFQYLSKLIRVKYVKPSDVYAQHSILSYDDPGMLRVSIKQDYTTDTLREKWRGNEFNEVERIQPGQYPFYMRPSFKASSINPEDQITSEVTTWMIEKYVLQKKATFVNDMGEEEEIKLPPVEAFRMVKTVLAGDVLVSKEVLDFDKGIGKLPVIPFYLDKSKRHPYGISLALRLEHSQKFINVMRAIVFKSASKAVSNQAVAIHVPALGMGDEDELDRVLEEGGIAKIRGNNIQGPVDIRNMVMPISNMATPLQPSVIQAIQMEKEAFGDQAQTLNMDAIAAARSGSGKRAEASANDRPKTISINLLSKSVEQLYDTIYEMIRVHHKDRFKITVRETGGSRKNIVINDPYRIKIPFMDEYGNTYPDPENPNQMLYEEVEFILNDTSISMKAEAEGRGNTPLDPIQRLQYAVMLEQGQYISKKFARELVLDEDQIARDDVLRSEEQEEMLALQQQQMAMQMQQQMAMQQMMPQESGNAKSGELPRLPTSGVGRQQGLAVNDTEIQTDANYI